MTVYLDDTCCNVQARILSVTGGDRMVLYSFYQSSAAYRVRVALHFKKIPFEYRAVDLLQQQHTSSSYVTLNSMAEVPTLVTDEGLSLGQSMAIFIWLDQKFPSPALFPNTDIEMAQVIQFCENINSGIHPIQNLKVRQELEKRFGADQTTRESWCAHWIHSGFIALEKSLARTAGQFCFGDRVTAADMFLVPQVLNAKRFKVDMTKFPIILDVEKRCLELECFILASPTRQPDSPRPN